MTLSPKSIRFLQILGYLLALAGCGYILLNPLLGVIEPIPDILPLIGNLDDIGAVYLIWRMWPKLMTAMTEFLDPEVIPENMRVDNDEYIDVHAETIYPAGGAPPQGEPDATAPKTENPDK
jgi:hypothetical protein